MLLKSVSILPVSYTHLDVYKRQVGMLVLVPAIRSIFGVADGSGLLAAIIVLAIMVLPSIIKVSLNAVSYTHLLYTLCRV